MMKLHSCQIVQKSWKPGLLPLIILVASLFLGGSNWAQAQSATNSAEKSSTTEFDRRAFVQDALDCMAYYLAELLPIAVTANSTTSDSVHLEPLTMQEQEIAGKIYKIALHRSQHPSIRSIAAPGNAQDPFYRNYPTFPLVFSKNRELFKPPGQPERLAKVLESGEMIFNQSMLNDPNNQFGLADAFEILIHELAHKIPNPVTGQWIPAPRPDQPIIDSLAAKMRIIFEHTISSYKLPRGGTVHLVRLPRRFSSAEFMFAFRNREFNILFEGQSGVVSFLDDIAKFVSDFSLLEPADSRVKHGVMYRDFADATLDVEKARVDFLGDNYGERLRFEVDLVTHLRGGSELTSDYMQARPENIKNRRHIFGDTQELRERRTRLDLIVSPNAPSSGNQKNSLEGARLSITRLYPEYPPDQLSFIKTAYQFSDDGTVRLTGEFSTDVQAQSVHAIVRFFGGDIEVLGQKLEATGSSERTRYIFKFKVPDVVGVPVLDVDSVILDRQSRVVLDRAIRVDVRNRYQPLNSNTEIDLQILGPEGWMQIQDSKVDPGHLVLKFLVRSASDVRELRLLMSQRLALMSHDNDNFELKDSPMIDLEKYGFDSPVFEERPLTEQEAARLSDRELGDFTPKNHNPVGAYARDLEFLHLSNKEFTQTREGDLVTIEVPLEIVLRHQHSRPFVAPMSSVANDGIAELKKSLEPFMAFFKAFGIKTPELEDLHINKPGLVGRVRLGDDLGERMIRRVQVINESFQVLERLEPAKFHLNIKAEPETTKGVRVSTGDFCESLVPERNNARAQQP